MKTLVVSANCGRFMPDVPWPDLGVDVHRLTDANFPPRASLTARMQAKIPKLFAWQMWPGYEVYVWVDARFVPQSGSVDWLLGHLGSADAAFFRHPERRYVYEERVFLRHKLDEGNHYITHRYHGEWDEPGLYDDDPLYAAGIFGYRFNERTRSLMHSWWHSITRYHINDQLSLGRAILTSGTDVRRIDDDIFSTQHFVPINLRLNRKGV